jgi:hypothetical protein
MTERRTQVQDEALYEDGLLRITSDALCFKHFYFPFGARCVKWQDIESVETREVTLANGKWRLWGSSDLLLRTWFPLDMKRNTRDRILFLKLRGSEKRIGFTTENTSKVQDILRFNNIAVYDESHASHQNKATFA